MAITSSLQLPAPILGLPARNGSVSRRPPVATVRLSCNLSQSTGEQEEPKVTSRISRRETLAYASSAFLATFLVAPRVEARTSRQENKRKVMEKLREKALSPKEKNGGAGDDKKPVANLLIPPTFFETAI